MQGKLSSVWVFVKPKGLELCRAACKCAFTVCLSEMFTECFKQVAGNCLPSAVQHYTRDGHSVLGSLDTQGMPAGVRALEESLTCIFTRLVSALQRGHL